MDLSRHLSLTLLRSLKPCFARNANSLPVFKSNLNYAKIVGVNFGPLGENGRQFSTFCHGLKKDSFKPSLQAIISRDNALPLPLMMQKRHQKLSVVDQPDPATERRNLTYKVHYPEDGKYTIRKLRMTKLAGRDPDTGRIIYGCRGGGHKRRFRWVDNLRIPGGKTEEQEPITIHERVLAVQYDPNRTSRIALVGRGEDLRYIIATTSMKVGDIIMSTNHIPKSTIVSKEGDAHPIGALAAGTYVCIAEKWPGSGHRFLHSAGITAKVKITGKGETILLHKKHQFLLDPRCIVVVGQVSNPGHKDKHIGSAQRLRWLGWRPRSGLWQRKDGRYGRKIHPDRGPISYSSIKKEPIPFLQLSAPGEGHKWKPVTKRKT